MIVQGMGGIISLTGEPGRPPVRVGTSISDLSGAMFGVIGILSALHVREKTGEGQMIDIAMLDCLTALLENAIARYEVTGEAPGPLGSRHPAITPFQVFPSKDGYLILAIGNDTTWDRFCRLVGRPELAGDERFDTNPHRTENHSELEPILNELVSERTTAEWMDLLVTAGIPFGPMPSGRPDRIGYGFGSRENRTRPSVLRAVLLDERPAGEGSEAGSWEADEGAVLETT